VLPALVAVLGAACSYGPVEVPEQTGASESLEVCTALVAALPDTVSDAVRREVEPPRRTVAAWGQPPVILRCGVPAPEGVDPTTAVLSVDGVDWLPVPGQNGTFFVTVDRVAVVEVAVPDDYAPEADVLADLAPAVAAAVPAGSPSG
jgi:hypothetical protein